MYRRYQDLRGSLQDADLRWKAPPSLQDSIRAHIRAEAGARPQEGVRGRFGGWFVPAAAVACVVLLITFSSLLYERMSRSSSTELLAQQVVAGHVRSLLANHLTDVSSTDQHTVKPWFAGKLDFAPVVKDFKTEGFPLIGGRLDYLDGQTVAAMLYKRHQHVINLFTWPSSIADAPPKTFSIKGFNVISWVKANMNYWAVSDLNQDELHQFVRDERR
jgi:anti-sigma factor RsiW